MQIFLSQINSLTPYVFNNSFLSSMLLGSLMIFLTTKLDIVKLCWVFFLTALFGMVLHNFYIGFSVWLACLTIALSQMFFEKKEKQYFQAVLIIFLLPVVIFITNYLVAITTIFSLQTQDPLLLAIDSTFGFNPSLIAGKFYLSLPKLIQHTIRFIYNNLPFALAVIYYVCWKKNNKVPSTFILEFLIVGLIGLLLYNIIPAYGPCNAFSQWPWNVPISSTYAPAPALYTGLLPRNCMPSLHFAWAYCAWRQFINCKTQHQWVATLWLGIMTFATVGLGEHYLVDLIMGLILAVCVETICKASLQRSKRTLFVTFLICLGAAWYLLILYGYAVLKISIFIPWLFSIITVYSVGKIDLYLARLAFDEGNSINIRVKLSQIS